MCRVEEDIVSSTCGRGQWDEWSRKAGHAFRVVALVVLLAGQAGAFALNFLVKSAPDSNAACMADPTFVTKDYELCGGGKRAPPLLGGMLMYATSTIMFVLLCIFIWIRKNPGHPHRLGVLAENSLLLGWARQLVTAYSLTAWWCQIAMPEMVILWSFLKMLFCALFTWNLHGAIQARIELTEASFGESLGSIWVWRIRVVTFLAAWVRISINPVMMLSGSMGCPWATSTELGYEVFRTATHWLLAVVTFTAFSKVLSAATPPDGFIGAYLRAEAKWARKVLQSLLAATVLPGIAAGLAYGTCAVVLILAEYLPGLRSSSVLSLAVPLADGFSGVVEAFCLLVMVGAWKPEKPPELYDPKSPSQKQRDKIIRRPTTDMECCQPVWRSTVHRLAQRSVSANCLLELLQNLQEGTVMPAFQLHVSTTHDVVRQAIIPLTRVGSGGTSYAESPGCAQDHGKWPDCMVTHTWGALFLHLVAAVMAEALGAGEYGTIAHELAEGRLAEYKEKLEAAGTLHRTYWICALCVNQHASICGGFGQAPPEGTREYEGWDRSRRDTATKQLLPSCSCEEPKLLNKTNPQECELNKFDDMMALLSEKFPGWSHLLVVDPNFKLFSRAWCIAEIVEGHYSKLNQRVCLETTRPLDLHAEDLSIYTKLVTLTVEDCEATHKEDKLAILSKIVDIAAFDAALQQLIAGAGGLLTQKLSGFGVCEAAVQVNRRLSRSSSSLMKTKTLLDV